MEPGTRASQGLETSADEFTDRADLELIAVGKRCRLDFDELNLMRTRDLFAYADIYLGTPSDSAVRPATQADIDNFYGH